MGVGHVQRKRRRIVFRGADRGGSGDGRPLADRGDIDFDGLSGGDRRAAHRIGGGVDIQGDGPRIIRRRIKRQAGAGRLVGGQGKGIVDVLGNGHTAHGQGRACRRAGDADAGDAFGVVGVGHRDGNGGRMILVDRDGGGGRYRGPMHRRRVHNFRRRGGADHSMGIGGGKGDGVGADKAAVGLIGIGSAAAQGHGAIAGAGMGAGAKTRRIADRQGPGDDAAHGPGAAGGAIGQGVGDGHLGGDGAVLTLGITGGEGNRVRTDKTAGGGVAIGAVGAHADRAVTG